MAERKTFESSRSLTQAEINGGCPILAKTCRELLEQFGRPQRIGIKLKLSHIIHNSFSTNPTRLPTNNESLFIKRDVFINERIERIRLWKVKNQIQVILGDVNGESLVLGGSTAWIQTERQHFRDINEAAAPQPTTRVVTETDLIKYQNAVALTRNSLIHGI